MYKPAIREGGQEQNVCWLILFYSASIDHQSFPKWLIAKFSDGTLTTTTRSRSVHAIFLRYTKLTLYMLILLFYFLIIFCSRFLFKLNDLLFCLYSLSFMFIYVFVFSYHINDMVNEQYNTKQCLGPFGYYRALLLLGLWCPITYKVPSLNFRSIWIWEFVFFHIFSHIANKSSQASCKW